MVKSGWVPVPLGQDLNPGPRPQSKSDDLDRSATGPAIGFIVTAI